MLQQYWFVQGDAPNTWYPAEQWHINLFQMASNVRQTSFMPYGANVAKNGKFIYAFYWQNMKDGPILLNLVTGRKRQVIMYTLPSNAGSSIDTKEAENVNAVMLDQMVTAVPRFYSQV